MFSRNDFCYGLVSQHAALYCIDVNVCNILFIVWLHCILWGSFVRDAYINLALTNMPLIECVMCIFVGWFNCLFTDCKLK